MVECMDEMDVRGSRRLSGRSGRVACRVEDVAPFASGGIHASGRLVETALIARGAAVGDGRRVTGPSR